MGVCNNPLCYQCHKTTTGPVISLKPGPQAPFCLLSKAHATRFSVAALRSGGPSPTDHDCRQTWGRMPMPCGWWHGHLGHERCGQTLPAARLCDGPSAMAPSWAGCRCHAAGGMAILAMSGAGKPCPPQGSAMALRPWLLHGQDAHATDYHSRHGAVSMGEKSAPCSCHQPCQSSASRLGAASEESSGKATL